MIKIKVVNAITGTLIGTAYSATDALRIGESSSYLYRFEIEEVRI